MPTQDRRLHEPDLTDDRFPPAFARLAFARTRGGQFSLRQIYVGAPPSGRLKPRRDVIAARRRSYNLGRSPALGAIGPRSKSDRGEAPQVDRRNLQSVRYGPRLSHPTTDADLVLGRPHGFHGAGCHEQRESHRYSEGQPRHLQSVRYGFAFRTLPTTIRQVEDHTTPFAPHPPRPFVNGQIRDSKIV